MPIFLKSESLSFLEPSGPVQACNGIALPLCMICGIFVRQYVVIMLLTLFETRFHVRLDVFGSKVYMLRIEYIFNVH